MPRVLYFAAFVFVLGLSVTEGEDSFTLDDFFKGTFVDKKWRGVWYDDVNILDRDGDAYVLHDVTKDKKTEFLSAAQLKPYPRASITISASKQFVLVKHSSEKVYRHSTLAKYAVLNKDTKYQPIELPTEIKDNFIRICRFAFDDSLIAVNEDNNIYLIKDLAGRPTIQQITDDGSADIFNGVPDWIYEEEVISGDSALWPSPYGKGFAFAKFYDKDVREFTYFKYGKPGVFEDQYPTAMTVRYPKAGQTNPTFSVYVHHGNNAKPQILNLKLGTKPQTQDYVLYDVAWKSANAVYVYFTNREQNIAYLEECEADTGSCKQLDTTALKNGWLVMQPLYLLDENRVLQVVPENNYDVLRVVTSQSLERKNTALGDVLVSRIIAHKDNTIYFEATDKSAHAQKHVYSIELDEPKSITCLSCANKDECSRMSWTFNPDMTLVTRSCSGPGPARVDIQRVDDTKDEPLLVLIDNADLANSLKSKSMPTKMDLFVDIPETQLKAAVRLLLPPGFSEDKKYPMMVNVYAGPNSNQISDAYSIGIQHYLVTNKTFIYAYIDGSGSGNRGYELMHRIYKGLGTHEIDDQITVTKNLIDTHSFIDKDRVGIWGWSYGGFATAHIIARNKDTFKCGVSVAPVTDFIYYDSIYTERYMGVYDDEKEDVKAVYEKTDVTVLAKNFADKNFMLVHGNADDNVHYQQGMQLARALEIADVPFEQMSYPDEAHDLAGVKPHLYHMLDAYWTQHLGSGPRNSATMAHGRYLWKSKGHPKFKKLSNESD